MARPAARILALQVTFGIALLVVLGRAGWLQLVRGGEFARRVESQRLKRRELDARRGTIFDRNGTRLALSVPKYHVQITSSEVRDTAILKRLALRDLELPRAKVDEMFRCTERCWFWFHGPFTAPDVEAIRKLRGVYLEPVYSRAYPSGRLAAPVIGAVAGESGHGASGLERSLDSILAGTPGLTVELKDASGSRFESPGRLVREPVAGHDVMLTIDAELQEIAEQALAEVLDDSEAEGGDIVFLDHRSGEVLAVASRTRAQGSGAATAFTSPFEPGSTAKPFTAAALLTLGRVKPEETVSAAGGTWTWVSRSGRYSRDITDTHAHDEPLTLARAIQVSSNIGVAKFAQRLAPAEQYDMLRAFGFGAPTGVEFPSEAASDVVPPHRWREGQEGLSMAIGYRLQVTALQLAAAYGVFANDGVLMAPTLVREIRGADGEPLYRHQPEVVRRVITKEVAARVREFLAEAASDSGTGGKGQIRFGLLGKTGTARVVVGGRYQERAYRASFAAIFPARNPQMVAVVTIDRPTKAQYYGGDVAAPVTARMLERALAARKSAIDRGALADAGSGAAEVVRESPRRSRARPEDAEETTAAVRLPLPGTAAHRAVPAQVPEVTGKRVRAAILALHQRGFRVQVEGQGTVTRTAPAAGEQLPSGRTVVIYASAGRP